MGLFSKFLKKPVAAIQAHIPDGQRVYCVGDIHGRADLLIQLEEKILQDSNKFDGDKTIVYLGDYIDRGEQSRQVIKHLLQQPMPGFTTVHLRGNHEQTMLDFMRSPETVSSWLSFGGREALSSYGITLAHIPTARDIQALGQRLREELPESHHNFLIACTDSWRCGSYYFVHAGIRPGVSLEKQQLEDQLWIRDEFISSRKNHGAIIVHGHSISTEPEQLPNRIGIDTGAYSTGVLTCLVLEGSEQQFLQTGKNNAE